MYWQRESGFTYNQTHTFRNLTPNPLQTLSLQHNKQSLPPLLPTLDAILVLDTDGQRLAGKYYGKFLKDGDEAGKTKEELRGTFEKAVQQKISGIVARPDAAEVVSVMGRTVVFCGGSQGGNGDVRVVHIGPSNESELVLAYLCEGMYDALSQLMGGTTERNMVLDNLELVFLLVDEHCDGGIVLETDGSKLAAAVLLRDDDGAADQAAMQQGMTPTQGMPAGVTAGDMTLGQAFRQAREQWLSGGM